MDLVQKRQQLRQRQVEKVKKFRQSNMSASSAVEKQRDSDAAEKQKESAAKQKQREREDIKKEVRKEVEQETQKESMDIENSDGTVFARVIDIIGPTNMKPVVSNGVWKGTEQIEEGSLHKWFKGSKSKDGKGGWVNVVTGGTCASDEPGEGTPKCVSSSKRASMSKAERASASRRKKAADPGQQSKSGAAKPTYVSTDKKKMKESKDLKVIAKELDGASKMHKGQAKKIRKHADEMKEEITLDEKCWAGYTQKGMKKKGKKVVPNCVPVGSVKKESYEINPAAHKAAQKKSKMRNLARGNDNPNEKAAAQKKAGGPKLVGEAKVEAGRSDYGKASVRNKRKFGKAGEPAVFDASGERGKMIDKRREEHKANRGVKKESISYGSQTAREGDNEAAAAARKRIYDRASAKDKDHMDAREIANQRNKERYGSGKVKLTKEEVVTEADKKGKGSGKKDACYKKVKASASVWPSAYASGRLVQCRKKGAANYGNSKSESYSWRDDFDYVEEGAAWTKKSGKNKEGGLNEKGRKSYERENPGSDLKAPQPEGGSRKKSFCARMGGMKKKLTSSKTANDPDSRINKALRKWKC